MRVARELQNRFVSSFPAPLPRQSEQLQKVAAPSYEANRHPAHFADHVPGKEKSLSPRRLRSEAMKCACLCSVRGVHRSAAERGGQERRESGARRVRQSLPEKQLPESREPVSEGRASGTLHGDPSPGTPPREGRLENKRARCIRGPERDVPPPWWKVRPEQSKRRDPRGPGMRLNAADGGHGGFEQRSDV